jgi:hypothetical protein
MSKKYYQDNSISSYILGSAISNESMNFGLTSAPKEINLSTSLFTTDMVEVLEHMSFVVPEQFTDGTKTLRAFYMHCAISNDSETSAMGQSLAVYLAHSDYQ